MAKPPKIFLTTMAGKSIADVVSRQHIISEAVYCRALKHCFDGGDPVDEWLMAEEEVGNMLYGRKGIDDYPE